MIRKHTAIPDSDLKKLREVVSAIGRQDWYVLDTPWVGYTETFTILCGSPDPHCAPPILETVGNDDADEDDDHSFQEALAHYLQWFDPACTLSLLDEIDRLKAELQRTERNRDMWREQVNRQATQLEALRPTPQRGEG